MKSCHDPLGAQTPVGEAASCRPTVELTQLTAVAPIPADSLMSRMEIKSAAGWWFLGVCVVLGIGTSGGVFGMLGALAVDLGVNAPLVALIYGFSFGFVFAAAIGSLVVFTLFSVAWMFWCNSWYLQISILCGAITGLLCGLWMFAITSMLGALGAYVASKFFEVNASPNLIGRTVESIGDAETERAKLNFSIQDVFTRMTVVAVLLALWLAVARLVGW